MPTTHPKVEFSGEESFWYPSCIDTGAGDVEEGHEDEPAQRGAIKGIVQTVRYTIVNGRDRPAQTKRDKYPWKREQNTEIE